MATAPSFKPWTPYETQLPPAGSYDPTLDANLGAVQRGLGDTTFDTNLANGRLLTDYGTQSALNTQGRDRSLEDLNYQREGASNAYDQQQQGYSFQGHRLDTGFARQMADLGLSSDRLTQDFNTNVGLLSRKYQQLGRDQLQSANARGVLGGTALMQAAAKRAGNQGIEQQGLQTSYDRGMQDIGTAKTRGQEDYQDNRSQLDLTKGYAAQDYGLQSRMFDTQGTRIGQDYAYNQGQTDLNMAPPTADNPYGGRQYQDNNLTLLRAQREAGAYSLDNQTQQYQQATQNGWMPASAPTNEFGSGSTAHRVIQRGSFDYVIDPTGKVLSKRRRS